MRKIVMYCDRCKKEFEKWNHKKTELYGVAEFVHDDNDPYLDEPKDLCESCYTELENWWNFTPQAEGRWREEEEYSYGLKSKKIWWDNNVAESENKK